MGNKLLLKVIEAECDESKIHQCPLRRKRVEKERKKGSKDQGLKGQQL